MHQNNVKFEEKDVKQRLSEALRRYGYKQVDVSKETGKFNPFSNSKKASTIPV